MRYQPPQWLERLSTSVLPPGSREHVLGDLVECSGSRNDYLRNLASALPCVIVCQIRRRVSKGVVIFNAIASTIALGVAPKPPAFGTPADWIGLTVPWAIWVVGCVLAAAYGPAGNPGRSSHKVLAATYVAAVAIAALVGVPITAVAVGFGVLIGLILVLSMPWLQTEKLLQPLSTTFAFAQGRARCPQTPTPEECSDFIGPNLCASATFFVTCTAGTCCRFCQVFWWGWSASGGAGLRRSLTLR